MSPFPGSLTHLGASRRLRGQKYIIARPISGPYFDLLWPPLPTWSNFFWSKIPCTGVPHIVLHVSWWTCTSGGYFGPLKSDSGVFWPFLTDFIMGKNQNANFSKRARCPIFKLFVVIREVILQKMAPILDPVNFFSFLTLLGHCASLLSPESGLLTLRPVQQIFTEGSKVTFLLLEI